MIRSSVDFGFRAGWHASSTCPWDPPGTSEPRSPAACSAVVHRCAMRRTALLAVVALTTGCSTTASGPESVPAQDGQTIQRLMEWLTAKKPLPGFENRPGTDWAIDRARRILVACDWSSSDWAIADPRVEKLSEPELSRTAQSQGHEGTVLVRFTKLPSYSWSEQPLPPHFAVQMEYSFGNAGMHRYHFGSWQDEHGAHVVGFLVASS